MMKTVMKNHKMTPKNNKMKIALPNLPIKTTKSNVHANDSSKNYFITS